jgi:calcineurin-like phosphoesterase family protein
MNVLGWLYKKLRGKKRFFTSDLHFGHQNVINYCNRPWATKEEMNEAIVKIWNSQVEPKDEVYILGDFSLSKRYVEEYGSRLNGRKYLITGNHDSCFGYKKKPKAEAVRSTIYTKVFHFVEDVMTLVLKDGTEVIMSHFPYKNRTSRKYDQRYWSERLVDEGKILLHGHLHGKYIKHNNMIDVAFDGPLRLYDEDDIIRIINDDRSFIPNRLTEFYKNRNEEDI